MLNCAVRPSSRSSVSRATLLGEDLLGHLAAAGELGPVAGVRGRGDDLGVDGGRGHAGQQDRRLAGQAGERRCPRRACRRRGRSGGGRRPTSRRPGARGAGGEEQVAAASRWRRGRPSRRGHAARGRSCWRTARPGRGRRPSGWHGPTASVSGARPVDGLHADGVGEVLGQTGVEAAGVGPVADHRTAGARAGWWKPRATGSDSTVGAKARPPRDLGLDLGGLGVRCASRWRCAGGAGRRGCRSRRRGAGR